MSELQASTQTTATGTAPDDRQTVQAVISTYLEAVRTGNRALFAQAFDSASTVSHCAVADGTLETVSITGFMDEVDELLGQLNVVEETPRDMRIDIAGRVASVRVDFSLRLGADESTGTDFFSLAKTGTGWTITHKLYAM